MNLAKRNKEEILKLNPETGIMAGRFLLEAVAKGIPLLIYSGRRTYSEQWNLRKKYLEGGNLAAQPGFSYHNYGLAIDVVPIIAGKADWNSSKWQEIGRIGEKHGFVWGGKFNDNPHFQNSKGKNLEALRQQNPGWEQYIELEKKMFGKTSIDRNNVVKYLPYILPVVFVSAYVLINYAYGRTKMD